MYVEVFVLSTEATYHRQFVKCAQFSMFLMGEKYYYFWQIKRFKCSYLKIYTYR